MSCSCARDGKSPKRWCKAGGVVCASGKEVAEKSEIVIIMVPDTPDVEAVLFGEGGVGEGLSKGKIVVDMSSISPIATKEFAKKVNALGADYLDAPVSGGEVGAKAASLTIMVGGSEEAFARSSRSSKRSARTSRWSAAMATARRPRSPTRSSSR